MKYIRTKDGITTSNKATHELIEDICCSGYLRTLKKGAYVRIGKEWDNFYGTWVDIIDENGVHYSIRPEEVKKVVKELLTADTIDKLCDEFVIFNPTIEHKEYLVEWLGKDKIKYKTGQQQEGFIVPYETLYGAIWTDKGLIYVAKMNEKGELELL